MGGRSRFGLLFKAILNVVLLGVYLSSGREFQVAGREKYVSLLTWSVLAKGM